MSSMVSKNIGKDAAYLSVAKIVIMGVSLLSNMLLSRFRTLEEYGTYSQINIIINLFTAFLMLGLPSSVNYFLSLAETGKERNIFSSSKPLFLIIFLHRFTSHSYTIATARGTSI